MNLLIIQEIPSDCQTVLFVGPDLFAKVISDATRK